MPSSAMRETSPLQTQSLEGTLREVIANRDETERALAKQDRIIADLARIYADERGLTVKPNLDQLRRELFRT